MNKQANKIGVGATNYYDMQWDEVRDRVAKLGVPPGATVFGVPRGGAIVAGLTGLRVVSAAEADFIVDDIVDSGRTLKEWAARFPGKPFLALVDKTGPDKHLPWVRFPWEQEPEQDAESSVVRLLQHIGEDPNRDETTPATSTPPVSPAARVPVRGSGVCPSEESHAAHPDFHRLCSRWRDAREAHVRRHGHVTVAGVDQCATGHAQPGADRR